MNNQPHFYFIRLVSHLLVVAFLLGALAQSTAAPASAALYMNIIGPVGSGKFGTSVTALPNGNIVVTDPYYDSESVVDVGAVYLYNGATGALISALTGSTANDQISSHGIVVLSNGNYLVRSPYWDAGSVFDAGAATWGNKNTGTSGVVSSSNSLVGSSTEDVVGYDSVAALTNGNYVVVAPVWDNGPIANAGAVTWGNGTVGITGQISTTNSLVGSNLEDRVGNGGAIALTNGNYVVSSLDWDNGGTDCAGAATWGNGATGIAGPVSTLNSLVGSKTLDQVSWPCVVALTNGNYVVSSSGWDNGVIHDAGASTWGDGATGITGPVSTANSLVGSKADDAIGDGCVVALTNGNYVVNSQYWDNGGTTNVGAATWGNGVAGITGPVTAANSLVGSAANNYVGSDVTALSNGNYVVRSFSWDNGAIANVGAATWGNGSTGISGPVTVTNSLVGNATYDWVSHDGIVALTNGNYVVLSTQWDNNALIDAGAATWGNGGAGIVGLVSEVNSLVGSKASDSVGNGGVAALTNGNYVVSSPDWDNGVLGGAGAATWGNGSTGISGPVTVTNSLVGSAGDRVSLGSYDFMGIVPLNNGNYMVRSYNWDNGEIDNAGAATWGNGVVGITGSVSTTNSLVGSTALDRVSVGGSIYAGAAALTSGDFVVYSSDWDNGGTANAGAVSWGSGASGLLGTITTSNSVIGAAAAGGGSMSYFFDTVNNQLIVGRPEENLVTLFKPTNFNIYLPVVKK